MAPDACPWPEPGTQPHSSLRAIPHTEFWEFMTLFFLWFLFLPWFFSSLGGQGWALFLHVIKPILGPGRAGKNKPIY